MTLTMLPNYLMTELDKWYDGDTDVEPASGFHRHVTIRLARSLTIPLRIVTTVIDTGVGYLSIPLSPLTLFRDRNIYQFTKHQLEASKLILPEIFKSAMSLLNPSLLKRVDTNEERFTNGIIPRKVQKSLERDIKRFSTQESFFKKQIMTRIFIGFEIGLKVVGRVIDLAIGIFCSSASFFAVLILPFDSSMKRKVKNLSVMGFRGLQFFGIIGDIHEGMARFFNPSINQEIAVNRVATPMVVYVAEPGDLVRDAYNP